MGSKLPVLATTKQAYRLIRNHLLLHLKAIWPPIVFLVLAEFLFHKMVGNADNLSEVISALFGSPWYELGGAVLAWLAGLKFLLSFSISWRRRLLLGEKFDPFYFKRPFWLYLAFLLVTYGWILVVLALPILLTLPMTARRTSACVTGDIARCFGGLALPGVVLVAVACAFVVWGIIRQVPYFTVLTLGGSGWRGSVSVMRGNVLRYGTAWLLAMLPIMALNFALDRVVSMSGANVAQTSVALGEASFRQAMLFLHFSLGASIGAITYSVLLANRAPDELGYHMEKSGRSET
jgi:hypothetical protein